MGKKTLAGSKTQQIPNHEILCYNFRDFGKCINDNCIFSHNPTLKGQALDFRCNAKLIKEKKENIILIEIPNHISIKFITLLNKDSEYILAKHKPNTKNLYDYYGKISFYYMVKRLKPKNNYKKIADIPYLHKFFKHYNIKKKNYVKQIESEE